MNNINNDGPFKPIGGKPITPASTPKKAENGVLGAEFTHHISNQIKASNTPIDDVRSARVSDLKRQIQSGEYKVDHNKVALALLRNISGLKS